jgi:hypothetical protein
MHLQHTLWPADELRKIAETDDLHISPFREDGVRDGTPPLYLRSMAGAILTGA